MRWMRAKRLSGKNATTAVTIPGTVAPGDWDVKM
jgi:hypothetical protein